MQCAETIVKAIETVLVEGPCTRDIGGSASTSEVERNQGRKERRDAVDCLDKVEGVTPSMSWQVGISSVSKVLTGLLSS